MDQEGLMMMMNKGKRTKRSSRMALTSSDDEEDEDMRSYERAVTEEGHDMTNCLFLLARGGEEKKTEDEIGVGGKRKVAEIGGGCYECKTCNKIGGGCKQTMLLQKMMLFCLADKPRSQQRPTTTLNTNRLRRCYQQRLTKTLLETSV